MSNPESDNVDIARKLEFKVPEAIRYDVSSIFEAYNILESQGVLEGTGIFLTDSDYTLRQSHTEFISGHPDRIGEDVQKLLVDVLDHNWDMAVVTDQPDKGHQIGSFFGRIFNYPPLLEFAKNHKIEVLGGYNDLFRFLLKEQGQYKKHQRAVDETMQYLRSKNFLERKTITWIGDTKEDEQFGQKIKEELTKEGYKGQFIFFKVNRKL